MTETQTDLTATHIGDVAETAFNSLTVAMLLTAEGAFIDGFAYFGHGHVFANVMTANLVLSAMSCVHGDWTRAAQVLLPAASYLVGVLTGGMLKSWAQKWVTANPQALAIGIAMAILIGIGWLPAWFSSAAIVSIISFGNAVRSLFFLRVEKWNYASTLPTGNLRQFGEALFQSFSGMDRPKSKRQAIVFGFITVSFFLGALAGGVATNILHNRAVWIAALFLLAALVRGLFPRSSTVWRVPLSNLVLGIVALISSVSCRAQTAPKSAPISPSPSAQFPVMTYDENVISREYGVSNPHLRPSSFHSKLHTPFSYLSVEVGFWERGQYVSNRAFRPSQYASNRAFRPSRHLNPMLRYFLHTDPHLGERFRHPRACGSSISAPYEVRRLRRYESIGDTIVQLCSTAFSGPIKAD